MDSFFHCGQVDERFQSIINLCGKYIRGQLKDFIAFDKTVLIERLVQIIEEKTRNAYIVLCGRNIDEKGTLPDKKQTLLLNQISINQTTGEVLLNNKVRLKLIAIFFYVWSLLFIVNVLGLIRGLLSKNKKLTMPVTFFYGMVSSQILYNGTDERFKDYCDNGPIKPLANASVIFVQEVKNKGGLSSKNLLYTGNPISKLLYESNLAVKERINILMLQVYYAMLYIIALIKTPLMSLLAKDIAFCPVIIALDKFNKIENIIITNSCLYFQPLWMRERDERKFKTHLVLYSQNDKYAVYKHDNLHVRSTGVSNMYADEYWVWTEGRKSELERIHNGKKVHVVGPILWYRANEKYSKYEKNDEIRIAIFDVVPIYPKDRNRIGVIRNQYVTENMILFIQHIVSVVEEIKTITDRKITLYIKHKRPHSNIHDERYLNYIQALIEENTVKLVPSDANLFSFLDSCDLTINATYTSVAYISSHLNKEAVYFDPADEIVPVYDPSPYISFASNREELLAIVKDKGVFDSSLQTHRA